MSNNPLANIIRFGFRPVGNSGNPGTDYLHQDHRFMLIGFTQQVIRFGHMPVGSVPSSGQALMMNGWWPGLGLGR